MFIYIFHFLIVLCFNYTFSDTVGALNTAILSLDLTPVSNYVMGNNLSITLQYSLTNSTTWTQLSIPVSLNSTLNSNIVLGPTSWYISNLQLNRIYLRLNITVTPTSSTIDNIYSLRQYLNFQEIEYQSYYIFMIDQNIASNAILPFNMIDISNPVYADLIDGEAININWQKEPYLSTYWTQASSPVIMPYIPYFSQCDTFDRHLFLNSLLNDTIDIIQSSSDSFFEFLFGIQGAYPQITQQYSCVLQEDEVTSTSNPWWTMNVDILYYMLREPYNTTHYANFFNNNALQSSMLADFQDMLVPVYYFYTGSYYNQPQVIVFELKYYQENSVYHIDQAKITVKFGNSSLNNKQYTLIVNMMPLDSVGKFTSLVLDISLYYIYGAIVITLAFSFLIFFMMQLNPIKFFRFFTKIFINLYFSIGKGYLLSIFVTTGVSTTFLIIGTLTYYSFISSTYDNSSQTTLSQTSIYYGRVGLTLVSCSFAQMMSFIASSVKMPTVNQAKIHFQNDQKNSSKFQDEQKKKGEQSPQKQGQQRYKFVVRILESKKIYIFMVLFCNVLIDLYLFETLVDNDIYIFSYILFIFRPVYQQIRNLIIQKYLLQDWVYTTIIFVFDEMINSILLMKYNEIFFTILIFYCQKIYHINFHIFLYLVEPKEVKKQNSHFFIYYVNAFLKKFKDAKQLEYQRALKKMAVISAYTSAVIARPIIIGLVLYLAPETYICNKLLIQRKYIKVYLSFVVLQIPLELFLIAFLLNFFTKFTHMNIFQFLQYNNFKFKHRTSKWISDMPNNNNFVTKSFRNLQQLSFSSQFYFFIFSLFYALFFMFIGIMIIQTNTYLFYQDPFVLIIFLLVNFLIIVERAIGTYLSHKIKLYYKSQQKNHANLQCLHNILKADDLEQYLELEAIKNHFLIVNKEWIVNNLAKLFSVRDFYANNKILLNTYLFYLNKQKRQNIEAKKLEILRRKQKQEKPVIRQKKDSITSIKRSVLNGIIKPVIYNWLYISKQQLYLKQLVQDLKQKRKLQYCQFCKIDIELEVMQHHPFYKIVNWFRIHNIGRIFMPFYWRQFYANNQIFTTICIECKEKKEHIKWKERLEKKNVKKHSCAKALVRKWMIIARSRLLHNYC